MKTSRPVLLEDPAPPFPTNAQQARKSAKYQVGEILAGRSCVAPGYTVEDAKAEYCMGSSGRNHSGGWELRRGKIQVPWCGQQRWTFSFAAMAAELAAVRAKNPKFVQSDFLF